MAKKMKPDEPDERPLPKETPEIKPATVPEDPLLPDEEPETIPDEEPEDPSPEEIPLPKRE